MKVTKMISRKMAGGILLGFLAVAGIVTGSQGQFMRQRNYREVEQQKIRM